MPETKSTTAEPHASIRSDVYAHLREFKRAYGYLCAVAGVFVCGWLGHAYLGSFIAVKADASEMHQVEGEQKAATKRLGDAEGDIKAIKADVAGLHGEFHDFRDEVRQDFRDLHATPTASPTPLRK